MIKTEKALLERDRRPGDLMVAVAALFLFSVGGFHRNRTIGTACLSLGL
jgi:hypothetical protein